MIMRKITQFKISYSIKINNNNNNFYIKKNEKKKII
jgi:hypothetical protein